ncbi:S10 family peptidase [Silvanigrella paludirubra]|nr:S10 family peptidase [Silvanigrella paludirubra]
MFLFYNLKKILLFITIFLNFFFLTTACSKNKDKKNSDNILNTKIESGYIEVSKGNNLFYYLVKSKKEKAPLIIHFSGGPGASSMAPAFNSYGPFLINEPFSHDLDYKLKINPYSWNQFSNVVFLEQTRYVGYSYGTGSYVTSLNTSGKEFISWIIEFYKKYPEFQSRPLYLSGESAGGEFIAQFSHQIIEYNKLNKDNKIPLTGLFAQSAVIGNADETPATSKLFFLCNEGFLSKESCTIDKAGSVKNIMNDCIQKISKKQGIPIEKVKIKDISNEVDSEKGDLKKVCSQYENEIKFHALKTKKFIVPNDPIYPIELRNQLIHMPILSFIFTANSQISKHFNYSPNPYNMKKNCQQSNFFPPWCYDGYKLSHFFNDPEIKNWIGNGKIPKNLEWKFASFPINLVLSSFDEEYRNTDLYYSEALKNNIKVFIVNAKNDYDVNYVSAQAIVSKISLNAFGKDIFNSFPASSNEFEKQYVISNDKKQEVAEFKTFKNLMFIQINNSGHMVGFDQPESVFQITKNILGVK